jgi:hypothetical protein
MSDFERARGAVPYGQALAEDQNRDLAAWSQDNMLVISIIAFRWCVAASSIQLL